MTGRGFLRAGQRVLGALAAMACLVAPAFALDPTRALTQYAVERWTSQHGLPKNTVQALAQTPDGYLWVGTEAGLARFDGLRFIRFRPAEAPTLATANITALMVAHDGALWIATDDGLVARSHDGRVRTFRAPEGTTVTTVRGLIEDRRGTIWVGAWEGVFTVGATALEPRPSEADGIYRFALDSSGVVWGASRSGLLRITDTAITRFRREDGLPGNIVHGLWPVHDGGFWLVAFGHLVRFTDHVVSVRETPAPVPGALLRAVLVDRHENVWVGGWGGLARYRGGTLEPMPSRDGMLDQAVVALFEDRDGSVWIGTRGGGLIRLRDSLVVSYSTSEGLSRPDVQGILADRQGRVWVGVSDAGVDVFEHGRWRFVDETPLLRGTQLLSVAQDDRDNIWFGTEDGLVCRCENSYRRIALPGTDPDAIIDSVVAGRGGVWVASDGHIYRVRDGRAVEVPYDASAAGKARIVLSEGESGVVWFTSVQGLAALDGGRVRLAWKAPIEDARPVSLAVDADGSLWMGTRGHGLVHLVAGVATVYTEARGLPDNWVVEVIDAGDGTLWLATHVGVVAIRKEDLKADGSVADSRVLSLDEGMRSNYADDTAQPTLTRAPDGRLWLTTTHGVATLDPARLPTAVSPPRVIVESVQVDGRELLGRDGPAPPGRGSLAVRYTATTLIAPQRVEFEYMLQGFDTQWIDAGHGREAHYTNLPPGTYVLRVAAREASGDWRTEAAPVTITLAPHLYQTLWARTAAVALGGALIWSLFWLRSRRAAEQQRRLQGLIDTRTQELRAEADKHLATAHALRQSEAMLQRAHDQLERRVQERTRALQLEVAERRRAEAELTVARDAAEQASRAKSAFVATMSHELRTPLNAVIGYAEIVADDLATRGLTQSVSDVDRIRRAGTHLLELVSDVLDLSKVEAGRMDLAIDNVDASTVVADVVATIAPLAERNGSVIEVVDPAPHRRMRTDATRLRQVLMNLGSNACKFTQDGRITVSVDWEHDGREERVRFRVRDTGIGIAPTDVPLLFRDFGQLDTSTTRRYGGTGLGLALSQRLCRLMHGEITVESTLGEGSCFMVDLPVTLDHHISDRDLALA